MAVPSRSESRVDDLYAVLGVRHDASGESIRHAYRTLARSCHPDVTRAPRAAERFRRLAAAYEVLGDADRRRAYDRARRSPLPTAPGTAPNGVSAVHRAPGPTWNPAVRGPAASHRPADRIPAPPTPPRPQRNSTDEWRLAIAIAKVVAVIAVVMLIGFSVMVVVTATAEPVPEPVPTVFCKTPSGWMDCRRAFDPSFP
jgi:DnaJ domain